MATQTDQERTSIIQYWMDYIKPREYPGLEDSESNGRKIADYIERNHGSVYSVQSISAAAKALQSNLIGLGVASLEQDAARKKAEADLKKAEEARIEADRQTQVVQTWLTRHCPEGLKGPNGEPFPGDQDRIVAFVLKNYGGKCSIEALNHAVEVLSPVLTWFGDDRQIRNKPAPPPRKFSQQARIDGGLELPEDLRSHTKDSALKNPADLMRKIIKKEIAAAGVEDPDKIASEGILVTTKTGRYDHAFNQGLKEIIASNADGTTNWKETRRLRTAAADEYERRRNRDGGQRG
jgi:hypothetical protein